MNKNELRQIILTLNLEKREYQIGSEVEKLLHQSIKTLEQVLILI